MAQNPSRGRRLSIWPFILIGRSSQALSTLIGADGVWQTEGFDDAEQQIIVNFSGGTGGLEVR